GSRAATGARELSARERRGHERMSDVVQVVVIYQRPSRHPGHASAVSRDDCDGQLTGGGAEAGPYGNRTSAERRASNAVVGSAVIFLVPIGARRFELYSEPPDENPATAVTSSAGFWHRLSHRLQERWHHAVRTARHTGSDAGLWARMRDWAVCRMAEAIAEQRTLWTLRHGGRPSLVHPSDLSSAQAAAERDRILSAARQHHSRWLAFDLVAFVVSGLLVLVPGPNLIAYYFAFRVISPYLSCPAPLPPPP